MHDHIGERDVAHDLEPRPDHPVLPEADDLARGRVDVARVVARELLRPLGPPERRVRYHPESQHQFAIRSLEEIPDWNISRQLWWGHQLPIWYCPDGHATCAWPPPAACAECASGELERDPDVLDTWFSSALWPFATLGWPERTEELARYYPGDVNSTAREIIRLWENRMIWTGLELLGDIPFTDVIIHTTILAPDGRRMSKSLGTGLDPLDVIEKHGADATRYGLLKMSSSQDVRFAEGAVEEGRKLANKLW
ncbi:MAG: class I tRNA ligase family protein, partial [Actinomycetota bacterium]|nr:class I tRNA ligase family protein [Actinomycetota bacterium]